jgi:hypothetical protein
MIARSSVEDGRGDHGLPITQSAISGAHGAMQKHLKSFFFKSRSQEARESAVVHAAAGESYLHDSCCLARFDRDAHKSRGYARMESGRNARFVHSSIQVVKKRTP